MTILTEDAKSKRNKLNKLVESYGHKSMRDVCVKAGISQANIYSNLIGRYDISIKRMFKLANVIGCDITEVIEIFHPELYAENQRIVSESLKEVPVEY